MVDSVVDVCNLALDMIKQDTITSLTEDSQSGRQCNRQYDHQRRAVLRAHPWNFAIKRVELAKSSTDPVYGWDARFALPTDNLRLLGTEFDNDYTFNFRLESGFILCNKDALKIKYVSNEEDPLKFDDMFTDMLATKLASVITYPITGDKELAKIMFERFKDLLRDARGVDAQEGGFDSLQADVWLDSRLGGPLLDDTFRAIEDT